jgi:hypothetical protein
MDIIMNEYWMESLFLSFKTATTKLHRANRFVLSEILVYYTQALDRVAIVHQYLRPDNSIGASGRPDPKCIFLQDKTLKGRLKRSSS